MGYNLELTVIIVYGDMNANYIGIKELTLISMYDAAATCYLGFLGETA